MMLIRALRARAYAVRAAPTGSGLYPRITASNSFSVLSTSTARGKRSTARTYDSPRSFAPSYSICGSSAYICGLSVCSAPPLGVLSKADSSTEAILPSNPTLADKPSSPAADRNALSASLTVTSRPRYARKACLPHAYASRMSSAARCASSRNVLPINSLFSTNGSASAPYCINSKSSPRPSAMTATV